MLHWFWPFFWILHQFLIQKQAYLQRLLEASAQEHSFEISTKVYVPSFLQFLVEFWSRIFTELRNQTAKCARDLLQDKTFLMQDFHTLNESHKHEPSALTTIRTLKVAIIFWAVICLLSPSASGQQITGQQITNVNRLDDFLKMRLQFLDPDVLGAGLSELNVTALFKI